MNTPFNFKDEDQSKLVYVRSVAVADLPVDLQGEIGDQKTIYAVHRADGERLALVKDRKLAFLLARQHDFAPVTVH
jgi:hypothetical protein